MPEKNRFAAVKSYIRTGEFDVADDLSDIDLNTLQAVMLRRYAYQLDHQEIDPEAPDFGTKSEDVRQQSRELLQQHTEVIDFDIVDNLMTTDQIDYQQVADYLRQLNLQTVPVLSSTPPDLQAWLKDQGFKLEIIPDDQINYTDFEHLISESQVPEWFRTEKAARQARSESEYADFFQTLKERWFVIFTVLLGIMAAVGFVSNWALELPPILGMFEWYLSFYGIAALTRSVVQINLAESWNATARREIRSPYAEALTELVNQTDTTNPKQRDLLKKATEVAEKSSSWDDFQREFGLLTHPSNKPEINAKASIIDQFIEESEAEGKPLNREQLIDELAATIIQRELEGHPPTVAVVIPTYQTTPDEMRRLLYSIKDQAYPVRNAYVVYNDNPNDPKKPQKQLEFATFQQIVNEVNLFKGRNDCQIKLLAQPARGKREAMAMGFAHALGNTYQQNLMKKYPTTASTGEGREELNRTIANVQIDTLDDFRHDFVLNIDSDTEIYDPMAVLNSAVLMKNHPKAATTTGDVRVVNRNFNLLSEMTYQRYWRAFFVERAAQSNAGHVTCMSGPWVFMRSEDLALVFDEWYNQESFKQKATYGDDRHLSTLFLKYGKESIFCPDSVVLTDCPTDWKKFLTQQLRWNKSFNRENFILFAFIHQLDKFTQFDVAYQQVFPFAMLLILVNIFAKWAGVTIEQGPIEGIETIMPYVMAVFFYNELFFGLYGAIRNRDPKFLLSPVYIGYHFRSLLWLKLVAIFQRKDTGWGTKGEGMNTDLFNDATKIFQDNQDNLIGEILQEIMPELLETTSDSEEDANSTTGESF